MTSGTLTGKNTRWVVVADQARAFVYRQEQKRSPLLEVHSLSNETAQMKSADLISDRGGRSFDSHGEGRHTMQKEKSDPRARAALAFAKTVAGRIGTALHKGECDEFVLIAPPRFLGLLREALATAGTDPPALTIDKEVVGQEPAAIGDLLAEYQA